jgi:hypothetical protein
MLRAIQRRKLLTKEIAGVPVWMALGLLIPLAAAFLAKVRNEGYILPPDARYYVTMTLENLDWGFQGALRESQQNVWSPAYSWFFSSADPTWNMVRTRMLYPTLSTPFVAVLGVKWGMLVVPALSLSYFAVGTARLLNRLHGPLVAVVVAGGLSLTTQISNGLFFAYPDALALALFTALITNLPIRKRLTPANLVWIGLIVAFMCITRQLGPAPLGMVAAGWLWTAIRNRTWRNEWLAPSLVVAAIVLVNQFLMGILAPYDAKESILRMHEQPTMGGVISHLPQFTYRLLRAEWQWMYANDTLMMVLVGVALIALVFRLTRLTAGLFLGILIPTVILVVGLGVPSHMRYEAIIFPAMALFLGELFAGFLPKVAGERPALTAQAVADGPTESGAEQADAPRQRWFRDRPAVITLVVGALFFAFTVGFGLTHGSDAYSTVMPPPSPSLAAADGYNKNALHPLVKKPAEASLKATFKTANALAGGEDNPGYTLDYRHSFRYRPVTKNDPSWNKREADGTAIVNGYSEMTQRQAFAFGSALSFGGNIDVDSVQVLTRSVSEFGEDVTFQVKDEDGGVHRGRATTLYPTLRKDWPGLTTQLVFDN